MTAVSKMVTTIDIRISRDAGLDTFRSTAATAPLCLSVTELSRLILIISLYSPDCQSDRNGHFRHYLFEVIGVKFFAVDIDLSEWIKHLYGQLKTRAELLCEANELGATARNQYLLDDGLIVLGGCAIKIECF